MKRDNLDKVLQEVIGWLMLVFVVVLLFAIVDVGRAGVSRLWKGHWEFVTNSQALHYLGYDVHGKFWDWPLSATLVVAIFGLFGVIDEVGGSDGAKINSPVAAQQPTAPIKKGMTMPRLPAFIAVASPKSDTTFAIRLGRVVHWIALGLAALCLVAGTWTTINSYVTRSQSFVDQSTWDREHPAAPGYVVPQFTDALGSTEYRPLIEDAQPVYFWIGAVFAFAFALLGRGIRYVIGGE